MGFAQKYIKVRPENISLPLKDKKKWPVWKAVYKHDGKKPCKVPYYSNCNESTGHFEAKLADLYNPIHLTNFDEAYKLYSDKKSKFNGLHFMLNFNKDLEDDRSFIGVDLDNTLSSQAKIKPEIWGECQQRRVK